MKKYSFFLVLGLVMMLFTQCSLDEDKEYYQVLGTLSKTVDSTIIVTDDDERLLVSNPGSLATLNSSDRVFAYFTLTKDPLPTGIDYVISIYNYDKILFKPILNITVANEDSIGNDPVQIDGLNIAKNYLNLSFSYYGSGSLKHYINMVKQPGLIPTDTVDLEVRHNNKNDVSTNVLNGLVTFDLLPLQNNVTDSVILHIKSKGFQQDFEQNFTYRY
jgi:hypothetical protein